MIEWYIEYSQRKAIRQTAWHKAIKAARSQYLETLTELNYPEKDPNAWFPPLIYSIIIVSIGWFALWMRGAF